MDIILARHIQPGDWVAVYTDQDFDSFCDEILVVDEIEFPSGEDFALITGWLVMRSVESCIRFNLNADVVHFWNFAKDVHHG